MAQIAAWDEESRGVKCRCAPCENGGRDPAFVADCADSRCVILDLRKSEYSACRANSDCTLAPTQCYAAAYEPVAYSVGGLKAYLSRWCGHIDYPPRPLPAYPKLKARCARGHCSYRGKWKPDDGQAE